LYTSVDNGIQLQSADRAREYYGFHSYPVEPSLAVVSPEERIFASGVTHLVRLGSWAVAPVFAAFRRRKPPEER